MSRRPQACRDQRLQASSRKRTLPLKQNLYPTFVKVWQTRYVFLTFSKADSEQYGEYSANTWHALFVAWLSRKAETIEASQTALPPEAVEVTDSTSKLTQLAGEIHKACLSAEEVIKIFETEWDIGDGSMTLTDFSKLLVEKVPLRASVLLISDNQYATYTERVWRNMYKDWIKKRGRFAAHTEGDFQPQPPLEDASVDDEDYSLANESQKSLSQPRAAAMSTPWLHSIFKKWHPQVLDGMSVDQLSRILASKVSKIQYRR